MNEFDINKQNNYAKIMLVSLIIVIMFIVGFLFGGSIMYGLASSDIENLQGQINYLKDKDTSSRLQNISYYYNETSLSDLYSNVKDSIVVISGIMYYQTFFGTQYSEVQGSGFIYEYNHEVFVITNNHVVSDTTNIIVTFSNGNSYPSNVIGSDPYSDLAILSINTFIDELKPLTIISSSDLKVGDSVIAIGSPMGLEGSMTTGIVSQIGRTIEESLAGSFPIANIIQTSVPINPGNSGGPLLNNQGEVVGITTAIIQDSEGLGFAIPSNTILREIKYLIEDGSYNKHPWLGISGTDMSYSIAEKMDADVTYGWLITTVTSGGAAQNAGLQGGNQQIRINNEWTTIGGDIIIAIDGVKIINGDGLMSYLEENTQPNQIVNVTIIRDNFQQNISVKLGIRPNLS